MVTRFRGPWPGGCPGGVAQLAETLASSPPPGGHGPSSNTIPKSFLSSGGWVGLVGTGVVVFRWWGYGILLGPEGTTTRASPGLGGGGWLLFLGHPALGIIPSGFKIAFVVVKAAFVVLGWGWWCRCGVGVCVV